MITNPRFLTASYPISISGDNLSFNYNTTNLKTTSTELNTIQDIATSASPTFAGLALGSGNLTMTGSLGTTGARLTKGWFTDLEVTNAIAGSITGNAATVTTNANLTGPITSVGNATSVAAQTGTGSTFVMNTSPTLVTPNIGAATGTSLAATSFVTAGGYFRTTGAGAPASGSGVEFGFNAGAGYIFPYNRDTSAYTPFSIYGNGLKLNAGEPTYGISLGGAGGTVVASTVSIGASVKLAWEASDGVVDTNLYRSAANTLKTDDYFEAYQVTGGNLKVNVPASSNGGIYFNNTTLNKTKWWQTYNSTADALYIYHYQDDGTFDWSFKWVDSAGSAAVKGELSVYGDVGGIALTNTLTGTSNLSANSTGTGTIKLKGATNRDSAGFIKIYIGTTPYFIPCFSAITG